ncbi:serpin family protein [Hymenobacter sp. BT664]|uniref:Serpin family protein n=1 Tax=Hymenobacter montanus TaxID=2771359 RepID=A0A927B9P3_9BACT|nr:serpin family protein [Hymenobacter montanus]MBD2766717.1 serpin family protein [Hymenobacter montanus]
MSSLSPVQASASRTAQTTFSLALVRRVAQLSDNSTVVLSPLGILAALALVMSGAGGATQAALAETLFGSSQDSAASATGFADQLRQLLQPDSPEDGNPILHLATGMWMDHSFALAPAFANQARTLYQAEVARLPLAGPDAASTINSWVQQHTAGLIAEIVSAEVLAAPLLKVVLVNAVYFQARWASEFDPGDTQPGLFRRADGTAQPADLMRQVSREIGYLAGDGWQAVRLRYDGYPSDFSMLVFVPDEPSGLPAFLTTLNATSWDSWHAALKYPAQQLEVELTLPRFRIEWNGDLAPYLQQMGLTAPFAPTADFTAMGFQAGGGAIEQVIHKTFLAVDEQGTEAAAVTAIMWMGSASDTAPLRRVTVKADSPFFYAIVDDQSGSLLFAGTVGDLT